METGMTTPQRLPSLAVLLPLDLEKPGSWLDLVDFLRCFGHAVMSQTSARRRSSRNQMERPRIVFYVGADLDEEEAGEEKASNQILELFHRVLGVYRPNAIEFHVRVIQMISSPVRGNDSNVMRELARAAFENDEQSDLFLLASNDLRFRPCPEDGPGLLQEIAETYARFAERTHTPVFTLGSCCILDETRPSEPMIPILPRSHLEAFGGDLAQPSAKPVRCLRSLAFELHFRLGCGEIMRTASCNRAVSEREERLHDLAAPMPQLIIQSRVTSDSWSSADGEFANDRVNHASNSLSSSPSQPQDSNDDSSIPPHRFFMIAHPEDTTSKWAHEVKASLSHYTEYLRANGVLPLGFTPRIALDIVVPSYRTPREVIERIFRLPRCDKELAVRIIVVCDNPASEEAAETFREIAWDHRRDVACRLRMNPFNMGPGCTRNQGLLESAGEYVLFLDDDVLPEPNLLVEYAKLIREWPTAAGFIGDTALPSPESARQVGICRSRICFGWDFARESSSDLNWGITANLCIKRDPSIRFDDIGFPKGGGGEDVDFCIRLAESWMKKTPSLKSQKAVLLDFSPNDISTEDLQAQPYLERNRGSTLSIDDISGRRASSLSTVSISSSTIDDSEPQTPRGFFFNPSGNTGSLGIKFVPAPQARVHHPWWNNGEPRLKHFVIWARGDRALVRVHPDHAFMCIPDAVEVTFALLLLSPLLVWSKVSSYRTVLLLMVSQPLGEIAYEIFSLRHADLVPTNGLGFALRTAYYAALVSLTHEYGRFRGHIDRGMWFSTFCSHFDWHHGTGFRADFKHQERVRLVKRTIARFLTAYVLFRAAGALSRLASHSRAVARDVAQASMASLRSLAPFKRPWPVY